MRIWNLDCTEDDGSDIQVYLPGPPGPPLTNVGAFLAPIDISDGSIPAPTTRWQRIFVSAVSNEVNQPIIPNPPDNDSWLLGLQCVGGNPITINSGGNILLSGQCILQPGSILWLLWDTHSQYVEDHRNEI